MLHAPHAEDLHQEQHARHSSERHSCRRLQKWQVRMLILLGIAGAHMLRRQGCFTQASRKLLSGRANTWSKLPDCCAASRRARSSCSWLIEWRHGSPASSLYSLAKGSGSTALPVSSLEVSQRRSQASGQEAKKHSHGSRIQNVKSQALKGLARHCRATSTIADRASSEGRSANVM